MARQSSNPHPFSSFVQQKMVWRTLLLLTAFAIFQLAPQMAVAKTHDVPKLQQEGLNDCGPTAAASCIKWFQQNGYPDIKTRGGSNDIDDMKDQLEDDAGTDSDGTDTHKLRNAMNRLINEGPNGQDGAHKKQLKAKCPSNRSAYRDFGFLDDEFEHGEDIIILLKYPGSKGDEGHYVTTREISGSGNTRTFQYMDPATGTYKTSTITDAGDKLTVDYDGKTAKIGGILTMSPDNSTESTIEPVDPNDPSQGTKITYTPYFPPHNKTKDLHVWIGDCNKSNWQVNGLPAGWTWDVHTAADGKCYLSIYSNGSSNSLTSGNGIEVIYTGSKKVKKWKKVLNQTTSGTITPSNEALPKESGASCANTGVTEPDGHPRNVVCCITGTSTDTVDVHLQWDPVNEPNILQYEIYNENTDELVAVTPGTFYDLFDLEADVIHTFVVVARNDYDMVSEDSDTVLAHYDAASPIEIVAGGMQVLNYRTSLASCYECLDAHLWEITIPGASAPGSLYVTTTMGDPEIPPPPGVGMQHEYMYKLSTDAVLYPGPIPTEIPYSSTDVVGDPMTIQAYALIGGTWQNVTTGVDPVNEAVLTELPELTTIALYNAPSGLLGDFNNDGQVDNQDFDMFQTCATGPNVPYDLFALPPECELPDDGAFLSGDFDIDNDIDQADFAVFQDAYGATLP